MDLSHAGAVVVRIAIALAVLAAAGVEPAPNAPAPAAMSRPTSAPADVYVRSLHVVYARSGGKAFGNTYGDDEFLKFFDEIPGGLTAAVPFLLNVPDASVYAPMLEKVKAKGIIIVPGVGQKPGDGPLNSARFKAIARNYRPFTDYIRLENTQGYYAADGAAPIQDMIDYVVSLGFKHVMLNPWPRQAGGGVVPFRNPELDATIHQVLLRQDRKARRPVPGAENWYPGNQTRIDEIRQYRPSIQVLINYESAPQHEVLAQMEQDAPQSSVPAMDVTATHIEQGNRHLHWCPPFTTIYDPVKLGTWTWIAKRLGDFK